MQHVWVQGYGEVECSCKAYSKIEHVSIIIFCPCHMSLLSSQSVVGL